MTRRITAVLAILLLALLLTGLASPPQAYVVVDDDPMFAAPGTTFSTIQAAEDSGALYIVVRPGTYTETVAIDTPNVTIEFQGAVIPNDGLSRSVTIAADGVTLKGDVCVVGTHDGAGENGDFSQGVGFYVDASNVTLDGVCVRNTRSFGIAINNGAVHNVTIANCTLSNVATSPEPKLYASMAIQIMGADDNTVHDCLISGWSGGIHTWYDADRNNVHDNRGANNYGWIGSGGQYTPRAFIEDYGVDGAENDDNHFYNNYIDGTNGSAFELADILNNPHVVGNVVRNAYGGFTVQGSDDNKARGVLIAHNTFYGDGDDATNWFSGQGSVERNTFNNWRQDNIGTIYVPTDGLGVDITGNTFNGGGRIVRFSATSGVSWFRDNWINNAAPQGNGLIYVADTTNPNLIIEGNTFQGTNSRVVFSYLPVTVRNNYIEGVVWGGAGSVIDGNTIRADEWTAVYAYPSTTVTNNRILTSGAGVTLEGGYSLIGRNYITKLDGSAAGLPNCGALNTCVGNWTAGQLPPLTE